MSTTEDQPAIGSPEWTRSQPPSVHTRGDLKFSRTHVWTDDGGITYGLIDLGAVDLTFRAPQQVRDLIAYLAGLAGEMDAEIAKQRPAEVVSPPGPARARTCYRCAAHETRVPLVESDEGGKWQCYNTGACGRRVQSARGAEAAQVTS